MPPVFHIKPQDLDTDEKRSKYGVTVVGCGHKGIFYATTFADVGFRVTCTDANASIMKKLAKGKTGFAIPETETKLKRHIMSEQICVVSELKKAVSQSDIIVIAITATVNEQKKIDYTGLVNTCKQVGAALHQGTLVVYGGIAGLGFAEGTIKELLENTSGLKAGQDFGLAYSPIVATTSTTNLEFKIAAADALSLESASIFLKTVTKKVMLISDVKAAEIATLFSVAKQDANIALANELAVFCENAKADCFSVLRILSADDPSFRPSIIEEENKKEAYLLLESAENLNAKLKLPTLARQINEDMVKHAANLTADALRSCGKTLRRGKVAVLGSANPASAVRIFVGILEQKGAKVSLYDPTARKEPLDTRMIKRSLNESVEDADCIVLMSGQDQFGRLNLKKLKALMKKPSVMVDLVGKFDPTQVETEGFIYTGLGRRSDKK
jgi:nucleotide sugar dehydrogenase